jgi:hypothetical protein
LEVVVESDPQQSSEPGWYDYPRKNAGFRDAIYFPVKFVVEQEDVPAPLR